MIDKLEATVESFDFLQLVLSILLSSIIYRGFTGPLILDFVVKFYVLFCNHAVAQSFFYGEEEQQ